MISVIKKITKAVLNLLYGNERLHSLVPPETFQISNVQNLDPRLKPSRCCISQTKLRFPTFFIQLPELPTFFQTEN